MNSFLTFHIGIGTLALLSGVAGLATRKGSYNHRIAGRAFFLLMLVMSASGIVLAVLKPSRFATLLGILTIYLISTAWVTVRRRIKQVGVFDFGAVFSMALTCAWAIGLGLEAAASETGFMDGVRIPASAYYTVAGLAGLFGSFDLFVIARGGISGRQRIARHLWRMCFALLIAAQAIFLGNPQVFPEIIRDRVILSLPLIVVLTVMLIWLCRTLVWPDGKYDWSNDHD